MEHVRKDSEEILAKWLSSCTRHGKISRNTVAIGIVVLSHLKKKCPLLPNDVVSQGGEVVGARSGLGKVLESYGIPSNYLKEITTRQAHQDGQRLFEQFEWGKKLAMLVPEERDALLNGLIGNLRNRAMEWLERENLKLDIDRSQEPAMWVNVIVENAKGRSHGIVEQQLVGAKLARRFPDIEIPNYPAHAADKQTIRKGDFALSNVVYHVTASPTKDVLQKCSKNLKAGLHPILLVTREYEQKARELAEYEGIGQRLTITSIETFVGQNIIELATAENKDFFTILQEIIGIYNNRLQAAETDMSLQIEVR